MALVTAAASVQGDAVADVGLTKVYQLTGIALLGESDLGSGTPESLMGAAAAGEATVVAPAVAAPNAASVVLGESAVAAPAKLEPAATAAPLGESAVAADGDGSYQAQSTPLGEATMASRALADDEIAGDVVAGSATMAAGGLVYAAAASPVVGVGGVDPNAIVRPPKHLLPQPPVEVEIATESRYTGYQPNRSVPLKEGKTSVVTDVEKLREANRTAARTISVVRKDSGVSEVDVPSRRR